MSVLKYKINRIVSDEFFVKDIVDTDNLRLSLSFEFKINVESKAVCCISRYDYMLDQEIMMRLVLECYFQIESAYFESLVKDKVLTIKHEILQYLASIAVGTARGEIHARCQMSDSDIQNIILPPINLTDIIRTPAVFEV